ncbi:MAG: PilZ domain-containing protein [Pseudomonadota bacterium]
MSDDRRHEFRLRTYEQVKVSDQSGAASWTCDLIDVSIQGCCLSARDKPSLPDVVDVTFPRTQETRRAQVIWHRDFDFGLRFVTD